MASRCARRSASCFLLALQPRKKRLLGLPRGVERMSRKFVFSLVVFIATLCWSSSAFGQATGSFAGTVTDKSGSAVAGATVTVTSQGTGVARTASTDETGHYTINLLPVSVYRIHVEFKGFQATESKDVKLQVDEHRELDFSLSPSTVSSTVEVTASEVAMETSNPSLGQVINSQQVSQLPLNGRDFVQLATLAPGTAAETNPNSFFTSAPSSEVAARGPFSLSVGGSRPNATDWLIDGVDNNELTAGGISILSNIDSIQEFKVLTYNYSAEYGTRAGPTVLLTTKSGTNNFHGSLYEFFRNTDLDAKSFFATSTEKFNLNQFGGSIGGPIRKNKTFFFVDGEQKYLRRGVTFTGLVPSLAMRNGDFSANPFGQTIPGATLPNPNMVGTVGSAALFQCNALGNPLPVNADGSQAGGTACAKIPGAMPGNDPSHPNGLIDPIGQAMMNLYPAPNANNPSAGINFVDSPVRKLDETKFDIRVDHNFSASDTVFARFSYDQANSYVPGGAPGFAEQSAFGSNQGIINHARNVAIGETHIFSPITVNQFSFGYNRIFDYITSQGTGSCEAAKLGIVGANLGCDTVGPSAKCTPGAYSCGLTSLLFQNGYWAVGDRGFSPFQGGTNIFTVNDTLNVIRGKHDIKVGMGIRANQMNVGTEAFQDGFWIPLGFYSGNPQADFLMGLTNVAMHDQTFNGTVTGRRWKVYRPFVQDDWRVTSKLTLNLGLAWDIQNPITEVNGKLANYNPATNQQLIAGLAGVSWSAGVQKDWGLFEPRIGFAYKLGGSGKTVLRGGYAIFHDSAWSQGAQGLWQNPPFFAESAPFGFGCPFTWSFCNTAAGGSQGATGVSIDSFPIISSPPPDVASFAGTLFYQPTNFHPGTVQQYNANVEQQLPGNILLTVGYAGSKGYNILVSGNNLNTSTGSMVCGVGVIGCNPDGSAYSPGFAVPNAILAFGDYGKTNYNSLQVKAETQTSKYGLYALIAYTYSHTYDNGLTDGLGSLLSAPYFPLPNWTKLDWAHSQIDAHNNFTASVIYDLPFGKGHKWGNDWNGARNSLLGGWQLTVIQKITSGFATPLIDSLNQSGVAFNNGGNSNNYNRPDQVGACSVYSNRTRLQSFNPDCFSVAVGHLGDASRVPIYGPDFVNTDFSVIKQFALPWETTGITFRAEFFNLWNHAQFGLPVNDISAAAGFGSVNSTVNNPRLIQFGLKFTF